MDKKLSLMMFVFIIAFVIVMGLMIFQKQFKTITRAAAESVPSSTTSLIFAWPLTAKADGKETVKIDVLVRNANTTPLSDRKVTLSTTVGDIAQSTVTTDKLGKATFTMTSNSPGLAELSVKVDQQIELAKKLSIKFE